MIFPNMALTDLNGRTWMLCEADSPVRIAVDRNGSARLDGLQGAPWKLEETSGVQQPGVTVVTRTDDKSVVSMELRVGPFSKDDPLTEVREFADGIGRGVARGGRMMRLECLDSRRFQEVRLAEIVEWDWARLATFRWLTIPLKLQSDESWWRAKPVDKTFTAAEFAGARVKNASTTDLGSWPWFRIDGPITGLKLGFDGEQVSVPITLTAGQWLEIETDPDRWSIRDHAGTDRTWAPSVGFRWHKRVPPRSTKDGGTPLHISGTGTSSATRVRVVVPQLFEAAL